MRKFLKFIAWTTGIIAVVAIVLRATVLRVWTIPDDKILGASIQPTLAAGDVVLVWTRGDREANDLVRCTDPEDPQRWVMGRIYGSQGDTVSVENGIVTVNGRKYATSEACVKDAVEIEDPVSGATKNLKCARVEFAGGWHFIGSGPDASGRDEPHKVGPGRVYLISDNREDHEDSRDYGAVDAATCRDKVVMRLWGKKGFFDDSRRFDYIR